MFRGPMSRQEDKEESTSRSLYHKALTFRETFPLEHLCSNFSLKLYTRSQVG